MLALFWRKMLKIINRLESLKVFFVVVVVVVLLFVGVRFVKIKLISK